ncbi:MAG: hypothetical protein APG12_01589 [Candidatus Methanofastidiosum methylothiophilum]|uniref:Uncharacterized protein n=1 Tax=Candidatus Methanofastidiosum methylothiophilum TaxID=1705564 RepID=A0A150IWD4_9EURY|nr:MAG: hypothetical protein APG10_01812 [Candidatus Methanofastidiosum methylthiophilus]KYC47399.1 MAG: hypothetical protein APG11_01170 [Candidatus Methanofastidiosum methylthiophilus]KYC49287.1 MAG: hypothetical protein APG12_01589 [Candidatus Methanofastidiosum methylthiophilus]
MDFMEDVVENTFDMAFLIEDLREIWRKTAPFHKLNDDEKKQVLSIIENIKKKCDLISEKVSK